MKYIVLVLILVSFSINGIAQKSDNLISKLGKKLFHSDERRILFSEYLKAYDEACGYVKYDTSIQIRAIQPNPDTVSAILYQLMMKNDTADFQPILALYHRQIEYFKVEWGPLYLANFYACDIVDQQYRILSEFENTLTSLKLKAFPKGDLAIKFKTENILNEKFLYNIEHRETLKADYTHHSPYFKIFRDKAWFGTRATCSPYEPYYFIIKEYILNDFYLFKIEPDNKTKEYKYKYNYIRDVVLNLIHTKYFDKKIETYIKQNLNTWLQINAEFIGILIRKELITDQDFIMKCFEYDFERRDSFYKSDMQIKEWIIRLSHNNKWKNAVKEVFKQNVNAKNKYSVISINLLQHFPDDDVVSFLIRLDEDNQLNKEASEVLNQTLKELVKNKEISRESKKMIQDKIKIIKVGNCSEINLNIFYNYTIFDIEFKEAYLIMSCISEYAIKGDSSAHHALYEISNIVGENVSNFDFFNSASIPSFLENTLLLTPKNNNWVDVLMKYARDTKCSNDPKRNYPAYEHFGLKVCEIIINNLSDKKYSHELSQLLSSITQQESLNSDNSEDGCTYKTKVHNIFMERLEKDYRDGKLNFE